MKKVEDIFIEVPCLTEKSNFLSGLSLGKKWFKSADKRYIGQYLQKFIQYNFDLFNFLGITPFLIGSDQNTSLYFRTSEYIGSIPLRAPDTGKQIGDFVITPRYYGSNRYEEYIEILNLLGSEINPQSIDSIPLASGRNFIPPMYLEAVHFINSLEALVKQSWRKFNRTEIISNEPVGQINWSKYINNEYKVEKKLKYPLGKNILNEIHTEYSQIRYVFDICKKELLSSNTPLRIKLQMRNKIDFLEEKLYLHKPLQTLSIKIRFSDNPAIKNCKTIANKILNFNFIDSTAWKVDFSDVFEKYIQHIFKLASNETGGRLLSNFKFKGYADHRSLWGLNHLEPDAIYYKNEILIMIDAKYKSHLYNKYNPSDLLKDEHRHDLHQLLCYCSFSKSRIKYSFLCYPNSNIELCTTKFFNSVNQSINIINILGIPLKIESINQCKDLVIDELFKIEKNIINDVESASAVLAPAAFL